MSALKKHIDVVAKYTDKYGDERIIHQAKNGLQRFRGNTTTSAGLTVIVGALIGEKIRARRQAKCMTLKALGSKAGLAGNPKDRIWEIECGIRGGGIRFGTLYAIAMALECTPQDLMPSIDEATERYEREKSGAAFSADHLMDIE